jgi:glucose-6-phosphate dehydrogenase assembly protein OpcA
VAGRRGDGVRIASGRIEGDQHNATAQLLAGWISSRAGCSVEVVAGSRDAGPSGVEAVYLQLDEGEEVRITADHRAGAVISQPNRPDGTVALPVRSLGDLLSEELRRLDSDEPYSDALEAVTGVTGLADRKETREHVWFDPAEENGKSTGPKKRAAANGGHK